MSKIVRQVQQQEETKRRQLLPSYHAISQFGVVQSSLLYSLQLQRSIKQPYQEISLTQTGGCHKNSFVLTVG